MKRGTIVEKTIKVWEDDKTHVSKYEYIVKLDDGNLVRVDAENENLSRWRTQTRDRVCVNSANECYNLSRGPPPIQPTLKIVGQTHKGPDGKMYFVKYHALAPSWERLD